VILEQRLERGSATNASQEPERDAVAVSVS
jgi:hypothetical protein